MPTIPRLDGIVVLVVDDNVDSRAMLKALLEIQGATVLSAACGFTALRVLSRQTPDVLLSDLAMPGMNGFDLIREIRLREKKKKVAENLDVHLPAAAVTAFTSDADRRNSIVAGFRFHIPKPIDFPMLIEKVASLAASTH